MEAGVNCYKILQNHLQEKLSLLPAIHDHFIFSTTHGMSPDRSSPVCVRGSTCLKKDITESVRDSTFIERE